MASEHGLHIVTAFIGLKSTPDQQSLSVPSAGAPWELLNKDEEGGDCDGREYNHEQGCIEQIPNGKILIFRCRWIA
jgi:hypothetical protein